MADEGENLEAVVNLMAQPDVRTVFVDLLSDEPLLSSTDQNEDNTDGYDVKTTSLEAQVAQFTAKKQDSDLLADIAQDLDVREKTGATISDGLAGILASLSKEKMADEKIQSKIKKYPHPSNVEGLRTPRVNHLIWNQLPAQVRTPDSRTQKVTKCPRGIFSHYD